MSAWLTQSRMTSVDVRPARIACALVVAGLLFAPTPSSAARDGVGTQQNGTARTRPKVAPKPRVKILISKETTHILQPLDHDGYVDYPAAVNRMASDGVTPENNAAVLFVRACGAPEFKGEKRSRFFELLGIQPLPADGDFFKDFSPPLDTKEKAALDKTMRAPWQARDWPRFAEWLKANERSLAVVIAGTRRDHYYVPVIVAPTEPMIYALLPIEQPARQWARALVLRAMLRLNEGNLAGAQDDLIACHRLARLIGNSPCLISAWVSGLIDGYAFAGDAALMQRGTLSARDALAYQGRLRALPPLPVMADKFDRFERLSFLDSMKSSMRNSSLQIEVPGMQALDPETFATRSANYWNALFRAGNADFDIWSAAARRPAWERQAVLEVLLEKLKKDTSEIIGKDLFDKIMADPTQAKLLGEAFRKRLLEFAADPTRASKSPGTFFKAQTPDEAGRQMGTVFVCLMLPSLPMSCSAEDRGNARETLEQVGLALVAYRADQGVYPARLKALVPKYLGAVPKDPCTGEALRYDWRVNRFRLYSLGSNGADESGRGYDSQPPGDDILLQGGN